MNIELWVFIILVICSAVGIFWLLSLFIIFIIEILERLRAKLLQARLEKVEIKNSLKQLQKNYLSLADLVNEHDVLIRMFKKGKKKK